jgi:diguanylate cyclase (GGDEF)-like protein/PAS domain S-box-containing protein
VVQDRPAGLELAALVAAETTDVLFIYRIWPDACCEYMSPSIAAHVGYLPEDLYADPMLIQAVVDPRDLPVLTAVDELPLGGSYDFEVRWIGKDGRTTWMQERLRKVQRDDGSIVLYGAARDITAQRRAEANLIETEELYRIIAENSLDVVYRAGMDHRITWVSPSVTEILGWEVDEFVGKQVSEIVHAEDLVRAREVQKRVVDEDRDGGEAELRFSTKDGRWRWMRVRGKPMRDASGTLIGGIDVLRDIDREVEVREALQHEYDHDGLTGLANRSALVARMRRMHETGDLPTVTALAVGLDDLKAVNEALTYTAGDRVLMVVGERLARAVGVRDNVARVAGNEFAVLMPGQGNDADAVSLAGRLLDAVGGSMRLGVHDLDISVSIGIATADGSDPESLLADASLALHQAKTRGRGRWEFLDPATSDEARHRMVVRSRLREALAAGEIRAWFQPVVVLPGGEVAGYEALVRWEHPDGKLEEPASFLPTAERTDLVVPLDRAVLRDSVALLARMSDHRHVAVNVSAQSLAAPDLVEHVLKVLADQGVDPHRLHLEITETSLVHVTDEVQAAMHALASHGVRWYVDDFGTGYSSITHLRDLPVAGLKLDRSFTSGLGAGDVTSERIAQALAGLAHGLELDTVAEGVETRSEADILSAHGWRHAQGYLFGRAARADQVR